MGDGARVAEFGQGFDGMRPQRAVIETFYDGLKCRAVFHSAKGSDGGELNGPFGPPFDQFEEYRHIRYIFKSRCDGPCEFGFGMIEQCQPGFASFGWAGDQLDSAGGVACGHIVGPGHDIGAEEFQRLLMNGGVLLGVMVEGGHAGAARGLIGRANVAFDLFEIERTGVGHGGEI